ncbi:hypothetical protein [Prosthecobacter fluviatilis]|uniref:Uncharacterized protein n=1 Tax=Prosthecobacter fluviatilis TaxID=445931 RepID=A0ABW0KR28_9BACT
MTDLPEWIPQDHPSRDILSKLWGQRRGSIDFKLLDRCYYSKEVLEWESLLKTTLVGVGEVDHGHGEFYVASDGRCFGLSCVHDAFYYYGDSFEKYRLRALLGRRARPMLRPEQTSVTLYGIDYTKESPETYFPPQH